MITGTGIMESGFSCHDLTTYHRKHPFVKPGTFPWHLSCRQKTLLNLGRHFNIDQDDWPTLCIPIEQILNGQGHLFDQSCTEAVEQEAQHIAAQLLARQSQRPPVPEDSEIKTTDIQEVDVDSLELSRPRSVGVEHLCLWAMDQVGFRELLEGAGFTGPQCTAALGSIIGRMASPASELATFAWLRQEIGLGELINADYQDMSLIQLYRASDYLMRRREMIEEKLFRSVHKLFGFTSTITLYDLTNTYFEGEAESNSKAKRGRSEEKRTDCPLLTLGLVLDGSGFIKKSEIFAGNVSEAITLEEMLKGLDAPENSLIVMDRGIASDRNLGWLRENNYRYLVVSRGKKRHFDHDRALSIETSGQETIHLHKVLSDDGVEARLFCYSEQRARKEAGISKRFAERFEKELAKMSE